MELKEGRAAAFVRKPDAKVGAVLLYGDDVGLIRERSGALVAAIAGEPPDPFCLAELTPTVLKDDPARLSDELRAMTLTGGRRVVRLRGAGNAETDLIEGLLPEIDPAGCLLLVEAGSLRTRDRLPALFAKARDAVVIACRGDDGAGIDRILDETLRAAGLAIEPDARGWLIDHLGEDRLATRSELAKLVLYKGDDATPIGREDIEACIGDGARLDREDIAYEAAGGDQVGLDRVLQRRLAAGESPVAILRTVMRHLQRLHQAADLHERGTPIDGAMKRLRPPVHFTRTAAFGGQLRLWSAPRLLRALDLLLQAEQECKSTGLPDRAICARVLAQIAGAARRSG